MSVITNSIEHDAVSNRGNRGGYGVGMARWSREDDIACFHDEPGIVNELRPDRLPSCSIPIRDIEVMRITELLVISGFQDKFNAAMLTQFSDLLQACRR